MLTNFEIVNKKTGEVKYVSHVAYEIGEAVVTTTDSTEYFAINVDSGRLEHPVYIFRTIGTDGSGNRLDDTDI